MSGLVFKISPALDHFPSDIGPTIDVNRNIEIIEVLRGNCDVLALFRTLEKFAYQERTKALSDRYAAIKDETAAQLLQCAFLYLKAHNPALDDLELIEAIEGFENWHCAMQGAVSRPDLKLARNQK